MDIVIFSQSFAYFNQSPTELDFNFNRIQNLFYVICSKSSNMCHLKTYFMKVTPHGKLSFNSGDIEISEKFNCPSYVKPQCYFFPFPFLIMNVKRTRYQNHETITQANNRTIVHLIL